MSPHRGSGISTKLKVLVFDVETSFGVGAFYQPDDFMNHQRVFHGSFMLSWAAKWEPQKTVKSGVLTSNEAKKQDDSRIVADLADLMREADVLVAHNANKFDVPVVNSRLVKLGLDPLGPVRTIDTLKESRKTFKLPSHSLAYLARFLEVDQKDKVDFELWKAAYMGDAKALKELVRYNRQDVRVLEAVYHKLSPYIKLPRLVDADFEGELSCQKCGSDDIQRRGYYRTNASAFPKFVCNVCGKWSRGRNGVKDVKSGVVPL